MPLQYAAIFKVVKIIKTMIFSNFCPKLIEGICQNRLIDVVLTSTHNLCLQKYKRASIIVSGLFPQHPTVMVILGFIRDHIYIYIYIYIWGSYIYIYIHYFCAFARKDV